MFLRVNLRGFRFKSYRRLNKIMYDVYGLRRTMYDVYGFMLKGKTKLRRSESKVKDHRQWQTCTFTGLETPDVTELQQIQGLGDDSACQAEIKNYAFTFKAFRCYYIALKVDFFLNK